MGRAVSDGLCPPGLSFWTGFCAILSAQSIQSGAEALRSCSWIHPGPIDVSCGWKARCEEGTRCLSVIPSGVPRTAWGSLLPCLPVPVPLPLLLFCFCYTLQRCVSQGGGSGLLYQFLGSSLETVDRGSPVLHGERISVFQACSAVSVVARTVPSPSFGV